ncbi:Hepatic lectin [Holothuria leucospilota]|uniref:Hepatic lectin n=1 Tax=Holothuria leucospilota TaxID=206669 RepID=A0A9Q1HCB0_HOLLE|nr:Hepatic lectin [Holothuria leucospilota]
MARTKPKINYLLAGLLLVFSLAYKGQCGQIKKEMDYIVFPKAFFSSNSDQLQTFLSNNAVMEKPSENYASEEDMTSFEEPSLSTSSDKFTSVVVEETERGVTRQGVSTEPVTETLASKEAMTTSQEPPFSIFELSDESTTSSGGEITRGSSTEPGKAKDVTQWHHWGTSSYKFINTSTLTWAEAANACKVMMGEGAHLVFIESELEDKEVSRMVNIMSERNQQWWIGLTSDKDNEGVWKWYNVSVNYTNWKEGQPDNSGGNENCSEIRKWSGDDVSWNDNTCSKSFYYICEKDYV